MAGMAVAAQEPLQPQHVGLPLAADDHRTARVGLDQPDPPEDEGAHDPLADLGLGDQQGAQPVGRDDQDLGLAPRDGVDQGRPARELGQLAHEVAGAMVDDGFGPAHSRAAKDLDAAAQQHAQAEAGLTGLRATASPSA